MPGQVRFLASLACQGVLLAGAAVLHPASALTITPLFDSTIATAANAAQIEGAINSAIGTIDQLYANPGSVAIVFKQGAGNFLGQSNTGDATLSYARYTADLAAASVQETGNTVLASAVANMASGNKPGGGGSVVLSTADARVALGLSGFSGCFNSSGSFVSSCGQSYDGVITLSSSYGFNYGATPVAGAFSAINTVEHEINEVLGGGGQGSVLNEIASGQAAYDNDVGVLDLYRYAANGVASFSTSGSAVAYLSIDGGATRVVGFNQNSGGDYADFSTNGNIQSAFTSGGSVVSYDASTPEFTMMESIGYDSTVAEPTPVAVLLVGVVGLGGVRRRGRLVQ